MKRALVHIVLLLTTTAFSGMAILRWPTPYSFVFLFSFLYFFATGFTCHSRARKYCLATTAIFLALGVIETSIWLSLPQAPYEVEDYGKPYKTRNELLGMTLTPHARRTVRAAADGHPLFEATFSNDATGLRTIPESTTNSRAPAVLFFGGSYTFGLGVNDDNTLPYHFEQQAKGHVKSYNLAQAGWGAHHILAMLENGLEQKHIAKAHSRYDAVYIAIPSHVDRAAGKTHWGYYAPRYILTEHGVPRYVGPFLGYTTSRMVKALFRCQLLRKLNYDLRRRTDEDIKLYLSIVARVEETFRNRYGGQFTILLWNTGDPDYATLREGLIGRGLDVFEVDKILSVNDHNRHTYVYAIDEHPKAQAYKELASFLLQTIR